jgi:predicted nucleotidyltransferase component of viral defense system
MRDFYRKATTQEIKLYQEKIYALQDVILSLTTTFDDLYLTGGTALARFYFQHRLSEDIDLFIKVRKDDDLETNRQKKRADVYAQDLELLLSKNYQISNQLYDFYYSRFYVDTEDCQLKVDVVRDHLHYGELVKSPAGFYINSLEDIAATKIAAFEDRAEIKDIIDLYYITRQISLDKLFALADYKRVPVAYENLLTINVSGISGQAVITTDLAEAELIGFVDKLKRATETEIKKKRTTSLKRDG